MAEPGAEGMSERGFEDCQVRSAGQESEQFVLVAQKPRARPSGQKDGHGVQWWGL